MFKMKYLRSMAAVARRDRSSDILTRRRTGVKTVGRSILRWFDFTECMDANWLTNSDEC